MSGTYSVEDLLKLRASPLICKPPNLPAIEEWMGAQEPASRRPITRSKQDETAAQNEPFQKRPVLDNQRRAATDPDRIVLGPPRRSFASSNVRPSGKGQDGLEETSNLKDRPSFHDKARNGDGSDSKYFDRKSTQLNGRYGNRQESEDLETEGRRDYDRRPRWAGRDRNDQDLDDEQALDDSRGGFARAAHSRAKLSQSWFRKGDVEEENRRDTDRAPDWRRDKGRDRDWDRSGKIEADPEWMDSIEPEEPFQAHTQEDFQRWKEKMRAGGATPIEKVESAIVSPPPEVAKKPMSVEPDDSMDKFFAKFESKGAEQKAGPSKAHGKTRFASFFSPAAEVNKQVEAPLPMPAAERSSSAQSPGSADADQAGFARILEMLQTRNNNPTPQTQDSAKPRTPLYARGTEAKSETEGRPPSQTLLPMFSGIQAHQQTEPGPNTAREGRPDSNSPNSQPTHMRQQSSINKDEVLLNLLRQASLAPKPQPPPPHPQAEMRTGGGGMFGGLTDPNARTSTSRGQMVSPVQGPDAQTAQKRETGRSMFDESPISMYPPEQGPRPYDNPARRATNGGGFGEDPLLALLRGQVGRPMQPPQPPQGMPPGLQRPPGLDQMPRPAGLDQMPRPGPSWPPQQPQPQQQPPRQPSLPPGLSNVSRGMPAAPFGQPQQIPPQQNIQQQPQQPRPQPPQPQRKYTGESGPAPGMPNLPPGMYPPPGFMNAGPPPGFPGAMPNHPGRYPGEPGPPPPPRAFMEMYGDSAGRGVGLRGGSGNGGMPPYR